MSDSSFTAPELRLFGSDNAPPPGEGRAGIGTLASHTGTAKAHTDELNPYFQQRFGVELHEGTFNLELEAPFAWPEPLVIPTSSHRWEACPIVLEERAIGVAIRGNLERQDLLEVISPTGLRRQLGELKDGTPVAFRLLAGSTLKPAG